MSEQRAIYIVESGEYSSRESMAAFSREEDAEAFIKTIKESAEEYKWTNLGVVSLQLDPTDYLDIARTGIVRTMYWVYIYEDGRPPYVREDKVAISEPMQPISYRVSNDKWKFSHWVGIIKADDAEHAIKIAQEQVIRLKASDAGMS